ncbi:MAG: hypothetical protein HYX59_11370 [Elusimicrobia bacterium]|nr:hypothetical protein [Elusimicrobiota bacterium]
MNIFSKVVVLSLLAGSAGAAAIEPHAPIRVVGEIVSVEQILAALHPPATGQWLVRGWGAAPAPSGPSAAVEPAAPKANAGLTSLMYMSAGGTGTLDWTFDGSVTRQSASSARFVQVVDLLPSDALTPQLNRGVKVAPEVAQPSPAVAARSAPVVAARAVPIEAGRPSAVATTSVERCDDLLDKARRLRIAAAQCDADLSRGVPTCEVTPTFTTPPIPASLSAGSARGYAERFEAIAARGDAAYCAANGGETPGEASVGRANLYYSRACSGGDRYACDARQIASLCFNTSPTNNCVRDCLVDNDRECAAKTDPDERLDCRKRNHWFCYERKCPKYMPNPVEARCFMQFPQSSQFLCPPGKWGEICR